MYLKQGSKLTNHFPLYQFKTTKKINYFYHFLIKMYLKIVSKLSI